MKSSRKTLCRLVAAALLPVGLTAQAQLEEVIVTATKVETSIQDTPIAVTAFTQDQLDSQLINDTMNLQFNVPNMTMTKGNFTSQDVRIRGIGVGAVGAAFDAGVGIHINGVYQTSSRIFEAQFFLTRNAWRSCEARRTHSMVEIPRGGLSTFLPPRQIRLLSVPRLMARSGIIA